jgi:hypothetical protein
MDLGDLAMTSDAGNPINRRNIRESHRPCWPDLISPVWTPRLRLLRPCAPRNDRVRARAKNAAGAGKSPAYPLLRYSTSPFTRPGSSEANVQNEPNSRRGPGPGLRIERCRPRVGAGGQMCKTNPIPGRRPAANRAKRTQFRPAQAADGGDCAKRSQTWGDWSIWAKDVVLWGLVRPGNETCKTNPILPVCGRAPEGRGAKRTQFGPAAGGRRRAKAQNEPNLARLRAGAGGQRRKTNPIWPACGRAPEAKCAKQSQLGTRPKDAK